METPRYRYERYAILRTHRGLGYFAERVLEASRSHEHAIADIMAGQVEGVEKVFAFNPAEHNADEVTEGGRSRSRTSSTRPRAEQRRRIGAAATAALPSRWR